jgi:hypothetical protein
MLSEAEARERAAAMLADAGIVLTPAEREAIESQSARISASASSTA